MNKHLLTATAIFIAVIAAASLGMRAAHRPPPPSVKERPQAAGGTGTPPAAVSASPFTQPIVTSLPPRVHGPSPAVAAAKARAFDSFQRRPFAVTRTSGANAWTTEDGRAPEVIRQLAHNEWEVERMTTENDTIKRRQLVYRNEPINVTIDRARAAGQPVTSFTLPALDGQEYEVEVTQNNVQSEKMAGTLAGHIKDRPNSMASIGFVNGYESFNLISPDDGVFIVADSREPGEVMVKEIDPGKYGVTPHTAPDYLPTK